MSAEKEMETLIVEAIYKAEDLAKSRKAFDVKEVTDEIIKRHNWTEESFERGLEEYVQAVKKIRESIEGGGSIDDALELQATGTGILLYLQSVMHSLKIAKQQKMDLKDSKKTLELLNRIRLRHVGGSEDDPISKKVQALML